MIILISTEVIIMKKTSFEHDCFSLSNILQNINNMESGFLQLPTKYPQLPALLIG